MAEKNYDGPAAPLEGVRGFLNVTGEDPQLEEITGDLGTRWEVLRNIHKPYPCGIVINAVIDGCLELRQRSQVPVEEIASIKLSGHSLLSQRADRPDVSTGRESQVSAQHAAAVALIYGEAGLDQFTDDAVNDTCVRALARKVSLAVVHGVPVSDARINVTFNDGRMDEVLVKGARGTDNGPLSDTEIETKFRNLAERAPACTRTERLIEAIWQLDEMENVALRSCETQPPKRPSGFGIPHLRAIIETPLLRAQRAAAMQGKSIVPDHEITGFPRMCVTRVVAGFEHAPKGRPADGRSLYRKGPRPQRWTAARDRATACQ